MYRLAPTQKIAIIAIFSSLAIATDYAMAPIYNVKLVFTLVFASAYSFGFRVGAAVALITELIWGVASPMGFGGVLIPFLMGATLVYAFAGYLASRIWGLDIKSVSSLNIVFGSIMAVCAFLWDSITNFASGLLVLWPSNVTLTHLLAFEVNPLTIYFMVSHELSDFVIGSALAPIVIVYFLKVFGTRRGLHTKEPNIVSSEFRMPDQRTNC